MALIDKLSRARKQTTVSTPIQKSVTAIIAIRPTVKHDRAARSLST